MQRIREVAKSAAWNVLARRRNPYEFLQKPPGHYDVAIAFRHEGYAPAYLVDSVAATKKIIWYHHGDYTPGLMGYRVDRHYLEHVDEVVAVSDSARTVLVQNFPRLQGRVRVIPNLIDEQSILTKAQMPTDDDWRFAGPRGLKLVTVGRLSHEKGVDVSVRAAAALKARGVPFKWFFVGDGPERFVLQNLSKEMDVCNEVIFLGQRANPFPYVRQSDIYVQTSRVEAHPLGIQEALVIGKPIVATDIPAIRSVLSGMHSGVLCSLDPDSVADAIASSAVASRSPDSARGNLFSISNLLIEEQLDDLFQIL